MCALLCYLAMRLMFVILCIPFTATDYMVYYWPYGRFWCRSVQYLIVVTAFASIYTLVLMSIDRFLAVVHPIRSRMMRTENITLIAIVTLWIVVLVISMPVFFTHDVMVSGSGFTRCCGRLGGLLCLNLLRRTRTRQIYCFPSSSPR